MDEQLKAAARRLRTGDYEQNEHGHLSEAGLFQLAQDEHEVAAAYLAEHPADDETPIDGVWIRVMGAGELMEKYLRAREEYLRARTD